MVARFRSPRVTRDTVLGAEHGGLTATERAGLVKAYGRLSDTCALCTCLHVCRPADGPVLRSELDSGSLAGSTC